jgi:hypothetical protein
MTLERALFGPGHCLTVDMYVGGVSVQDVRAAVTACKNDLGGVSPSIGIDHLVALRLYTLERPPVYKLLI